MTADQNSLNHLPYYREYVEQILKPRVVKLIDEVRSGLAAHAWHLLLARMAEDQNPGSAADDHALLSIRSMLENTLGLHVGVQMQAEFGNAAPPVSHQAEQIRRPDQVDVIERGFLENPLARAVNGVRRNGR
jgi:hypothetical protein